MLFDTGIVTDFGILKFHLDVKDRLEIMSFDENWVDLIVQMLQCGGDRGGDTIQNDFIHVIDIRFPKRALFIDFNSIMDFFNEFVNGGSVLLNDLLLTTEEGLMNLGVVVGSHGLAFSLDDFHVNGFEALLDLLDGFFHLLNDFIGGVDHILSFGNEFVDVFS